MADTPPRTRRQALIKTIEERTNSKLIAIATSERPGVSAHLEEGFVVATHDVVKGRTLDDGKAISLLVYSRGGHGSVPLELVAMLREHYAKTKLLILVPYRAYSAATVIALGGDEIIMGPRGHLGPIDATIHNYPHNPRDDFGNLLPVGAEEVRKYYELVKTMALNNEANAHQLELAAFSALTQSVSPLALGSVQRTLKSTEHDATVLLEARLNPKSKEQNETIIKKLASEITYHGHAIFRSEARNLGIDFVVNSEEYGIANEMWDLTEEYMEFFEVGKPFDTGADVEFRGKDNAEMNEVPIGIVETADAGRKCLVDYFYKKVRNQKASCNLNTQLDLTPSGLKDIVDGVESRLMGMGLDDTVPTQQITDGVLKSLRESIQEWVAKEGSKALRTALDDSLPSYVREYVYNSRWVDV